jgi:tetratricopeptide (TPR) repeat protein
VNRVNRYLLIVLVASVVATNLPQSESRAQAVECSVDDLRCLTEGLQQACEQPASVEESCVTWLSRVDRLDLTQYPEAQLLMAGSYYTLASRIASSEADAARYRERSRIAYQEVLALWPTGEYGFRANLGLANLADNGADKILFARRGMQAAPGDERAMRALAMILVSRGEVVDRREAAGLYLDAFAASGRPFSWYYAYRAIGIYEGIGLYEQASAAREMVERVSEVQRMSIDISSGRIAQDLSLAGEVLEVACDAYYIEISGSETCANAVDALATEASRLSVPLERRKAVVDVATEGIRLLGAAGDRTLTLEEISQRQQQQREHLQTWIDNGSAAAATYVRLAELTPDLDERVATMERAVELAPNNGQFRYWLALEYIEQGKPDDAMEQLQAARSAAEEVEDPGISLEAIDSRIRQVESIQRAR